MAKEKKPKQKLFVPGEYGVNETKKTVVYGVKAHGLVFIGKANCGPHDEFDVERGKAIAHIRAVIEQRKYDLFLTRQFIELVQSEMDYATNYNDGPVSPHFMRSLQIANNEAKAQLAHIHKMEERLAELTK